MSVTVILCEYGTLHGDGTFTLVRGGITSWRLSELPAALNVMAFARVDPSDPPADDRRQVLLKAISPSGEQVLALELESPEGSRPEERVALIGFPLLVTQPGTYTIEVMFGGTAKGQSTLAVSREATA
jgi:hypothetical protein